MSSGEPVSFDAYYPLPLDGWYELRAWPTPDGLSVYFLEVTDRRAAQERAERSSRQLALLAQVSAELAGTLDTQVATARLPRLVVPALADFCVLTTIGADGAPQDVGSWHADPAARPLLERYREVRLDAMPMTAPVARALHTGEAATFSGSDVLEVLPVGPARDLLAELDPATEVALPLRARGRTVGLLTLFYADGNAPGAEDVAVAQDVADRAGLAWDNARLFSAQQQLAEGLQRSLLTDPPEPEHAEIAVRYLPAAEAARVGGDWYDAFLQPGGTTMLVIGDVVGHDTEAAAAMGQLRSLLRGIATYSDAGPVEVLRGLDSSMSTLQLGTLATAAVARFEQTPEDRRLGVTRMRWANAGHLPPLVVAPDGSVGELSPWVGDLLLGVDAGVVRRESEVVLEHGSTVLLYTDGLVERRDSDLDAGVARLRQALAELADLPLEDLLDELLQRLVQGRPDDDVALVAVRLRRQEPDAGAPLAAVAPHRGLPALDHRGAQRLDDLVGRRLRDLHQGEALVDLDRADVLAAEPGLPGDGPDQVAGPDAGLPAQADEQPPRRPGRTAAGGPLPAGGTLAARAAAGVPVGPEADLRDLLVVVGPADGLVGQLDRRQRHLHEVELVGEGLDDDPEAVELVARAGSRGARRG